MTPPDNVPPQSGAPQPEIPSFKDTKEENEKKGGGFSWFGKGGGGPKPLLRVRGLGGTSIIERLKQFRKKDLAFIASGIAVLLLAPLAEHYILGPGEEQKTLTQGFDQKGNPFSDAAGNVYEPGAGGFAPGGLPGQSSDVITPLNVRDPAALVMGPGAAQQPPTQVPPAKETSKEDWKEALSNAAQKSARAAEPAPFNKGTLAGSIRGLSALSGASGGGGPSFSLPAPSASNVPNKAGGGGSLTRVQAAPGFQGAAGHSNSQGSGGADALRRAAEQAANQFNRAGGAAGALQSAASQNIPGGGSADDRGGPGGGSDNKAPGGNQNKDNKSLGESLAFLKAKMELEKAIDLKWKKINWNDFEKAKMMQETIIKAALDGIVKQGFIDPLGKAIADIFPSPEKGPSTCVWVKGDEHDEVTFPSAKARDECKKGGKDVNQGSDKCHLYQKFLDKYLKDPLFCTGKPGKPDDQKPSPETVTTMNGSPFKPATGLTDEINKTGDALDELGRKIGIARGAGKNAWDQLNVKEITDPKVIELRKKLEPTFFQVIYTSLNYLDQLKDRLQKVKDSMGTVKNLARSGMDEDGKDADQVLALVNQAITDLGTWKGIDDNTKTISMEKIKAIEKALEELEKKNPHGHACGQDQKCLEQITLAEDGVGKARENLCGNKEKGCTDIDPKNLVEAGAGSISGLVKDIHTQQGQIEAAQQGISEEEYPVFNVFSKGKMQEVVDRFKEAVGAGDGAYNSVNKTVQNTWGTVRQAHIADAATSQAEDKVRNGPPGSVYLLLQTAANPPQSGTTRASNVDVAQNAVGQGGNPDGKGMATASSLEAKAHETIASAKEAIGTEATQNTANPAK